MIVKKWNLLIVHTFVLSGNRFNFLSAWYSLTRGYSVPVPFSVHKIQNQIRANHDQVKAIKEQYHITAVEQLMRDAADIPNENGQGKYKTLAF